MNLNVEIKGQGLPILCLHGHPGSSACLSVFTNHLSHSFQTIAPDLRGYGKSPAQGNFKITDHLTDLETLLENLKIDKYLILGWSLGGIIALEMALRHTKRVQGLILIATAACPRGNHPPITWQDNLYTAIAGITNYLKPGWQWNIDTFGKRSLFRYLICQHSPQCYQYLAKEAVPAYLQTSSAAQKALSTALKNGYNRLEYLKLIEAPCLVLAGSQDRHITSQSSEETASHLPNCQWKCYSDTAHLFPWEIPTQVARDIDDWIDKYLMVN